MNLKFNVMVTVFYIWSVFFFNILFLAVFVEYSTVRSFKDFYRFNEFFIVKVNLLYLLSYFVIFFDFFIPQK